MYIGHRTTYNTHHTICIVHRKMHIVQCTPYNLLYTIYTLYSVHYLIQDYPQKVSNTTYVCRYTLLWSQGSYVNFVI